MGFFSLQIGKGDPPAAPRRTRLHETVQDLFKLPAMSEFAQLGDIARDTIDAESKPIPARVEPVAYPDDDSWEGYDDDSRWAPTDATCPDVVDQDAAECLAAIHKAAREFVRLHRLHADLTQALQDASGAFRATLAEADWFDGGIKLPMVVDSFLLDHKRGKGGGISPAGYTVTPVHVAAPVPSPLPKPGQWYPFDVLPVGHWFAFGFGNVTPWQKVKADLAMTEPDDMYRCDAYPVRPDLEVTYLGSTWPCVEPSST